MSGIDNHRTHDEQRVQEGRAAYEALSKITNWGTIDFEFQGFVDAFFRDHRTNQQGIFRLFVQLCQEFAARVKKDGEATWTDERNRASASLAKKIVFLDLYLPYI